MVEPAGGALYGRESMAWRLNRESLVLLGGPRAAILQICDPGVAAGVAAYSTYKTDPFGRLQRTLDSMLAISFGTPAKREKTLAKLEEIHSHVNGKLSDGSGYSALEPDRQFWILATLTDTVIEVDRRFGGKMRHEDRVTYYHESKRIAGAFGIPDSEIPQDYDEFRDYLQERIATLQPTEESREIAKTLMFPRVQPIPSIAWLPFSMITNELLPTAMSRALGFRNLNLAELATVRAGHLVIRNSVAHLSGPLLANPLSAKAVDTAA